MKKKKMIRRLQRYNNCILFITYVHLGIASHLHRTFLKKKVTSFFSLQTFNHIDTYLHYSSHYPKRFSKMRKKQIIMRISICVVTCWQVAYSFSFPQKLPSFSTFSCFPSLSLTTSSSLASVASSSPTSENKNPLPIDDQNEGQKDTRLPGKRKWLGGAITPDKQQFYGIPAHAHSIIRVKVNQNEDAASRSRANIDAIPLPKQFQKRRFKWLRGIIAGDYLFGIPSWSSSGVLRVNIQDNFLHSDSNVEHENDDDDNTHDTRAMNMKAKKKSEVDRVDILPLPSSSIPISSSQRWLWHGAALIHETNELNQDLVHIYCVPANANRVLKVTSSIDAFSYNSNEKIENNYCTSYIGPDLSNHFNKWYGGIMGQDQAIYGIPYAAGSILRIDTKSDEVELLGDFGTGQYNWHGGVYSPISSAIYAFPSHASTVLKINTSMDKQQQGERPFIQLPIDASNDVDLNMKYKWLGGAIGIDGCIYGMPSDNSSILKIDPKTDTCLAFGSTILSEFINRKNKWQGGVLAPKDGCIYAIPSDANCVLKIDTNIVEDDKHESNDWRISFLELPSIQDSDSDLDYSQVTDKWQGGFLAADGNIYAIPENAERMLRVIVGDNRHTWEQSRNEANFKTSSLELL